MFTSVPTTFSYYLDRLSCIVKKIEIEGGSSLLNARLNDNMLPLVNHIRACANFSLRGCCPLAGVELVLFDNDENTFDGVQKQIALTQNKIQSLQVDEGNVGGNAKAEFFEDTAGFANVRLAPPEYIFQYIFPNFYFHLNMVYAIARSEGVSLSKQDYDGYHQYPSGFSFEQPAT